MDRNYAISSKFLGVYETNRNLRAYQFTYEPNGEIQQEMLPFVQAFGLAGKDIWVLTPEEMHHARVLAGQEPGAGDNPAWEEEG